MTTEENKLTAAEQAQVNLIAVRELFVKHPILAECQPKFRIHDFTVEYWDHWSARAIIDATPEFGWAEALEHPESGQVNAVAVVSSIKLVVRWIRTLDKVEKFEPFIPRDLNPANKEFVEVGA